MELDPDYEPEEFVTGRLTEVIKLCHLSALARDSEHPDLGYKSELGKKIRANYFMVLSAYRSHAARFEVAWEIPDWDSSVDVPPDQQVVRMLRGWRAEDWLVDEVSAVRRALGCHLALLDAARDRETRKRRKMLNRTLFLVGSEAQAMYNCVTRIRPATRAERKRLRSEKGPEVS